MIFNQYTVQQLSSLVRNKSNFTFTVPIAHTVHIQDNLLPNVKTIIPISGVTEMILAHLSLSGNSEITNFEVVTSMTSYQGGRIYFTYTNSTDCFVEIEY